MNTYLLYVNPKHEPDESLREQMTFFNPFHASVIEGAPANPHDAEQDIGSVVILSGN